MKQFWLMPTFSFWVSKNWFWWIMRCINFFMGERGRSHLLLSAPICWFIYLTILVRTGSRWSWKGGIQFRSPYRGGLDPTIWAAITCCLLGFALTGRWNEEPDLWLRSGHSDKGHGCFTLCFNWRAKHRLLFDSCFSYLLLLSGYRLWTFSTLQFSLWIYV